MILLFLVVEIEKGIMNKLFRKKKKQLENTVASRYYKKSFESEFSQTIELIFRWNRRNVYNRDI